MNTDKIIAEKIAGEYAPKQASKIVALKKLDRLARRNAEIFAFTFGIVFALVLGLGMSFAMGVLGDGSITYMAVGIVIGLLGIAGVSVNYPIYKKLLQNDKKKYGNDIIKLAQEIAEEE